MYDFTVGLARHRPLGAVRRRFLAAVADRPAEVDRFLGAFAGITPVDRYFSIGDSVRLLGLRGFATAAGCGSLDPVSHVR